MGKAKAYRAPHLKGMKMGFEITQDDNMFTMMVKEMGHRLRELASTARGSQDMESHNLGSIFLIAPVQICQKSRRIGCVIPYCNLQCLHNLSFAFLPMRPYVDTREALLRASCTGPPAYNHKKDLLTLRMIG